MSIQEKTESTAEAWESGELGRDEEYAQAVEIDEDSLDESLALQMISIRLQKSLIHDLKYIAKINGIGYQPLIKQALTRFVDGEKKIMLRRLATEQAHMEAEQAEHEKEEHRHCA